MLHDSKGSTSTLQARHLREKIPAPHIRSYRKNTDIKARIERRRAYQKSRDNTRNHATISAVIFETKSINKELPSKGRLFLVSFGFSFGTIYTSHIAHPLRIALLRHFLYEELCMGRHLVYTSIYESSVSPDGIMHGLRILIVMPVPDKWRRKARTSS